jgi:hypothetical protein
LLMIFISGTHAFDVTNQRHVDNCAAIETYSC